MGFHQENLNYSPRVEFIPRCQKFNIGLYILKSLEVSLLLIIRTKAIDFNPISGISCSKPNGQMLRCLAYTDFTHWPVERYSALMGLFLDFCTCDIDVNSYQVYIWLTPILIRTALNLLDSIHSLVILDIEINVGAYIA